MYDLWYYSLNGRTHGPVTTAEIKRLAVVGDLPPDAPLWPKGVDPGFAVEASAAIGIVPVAKPLPVPLPKLLDDVRRAEATARRKTAEDWPLPSWLKGIRGRESNRPVDVNRRSSSARLNRQAVRNRAEEQIDAEDNYRISVRRGSSEEVTPKKQRRNMKKQDESEDQS